MNIFKAFGRAAFFVVLLAVQILILSVPGLAQAQAIDCGTEQGSTEGSGFATGGTGQYKDEIFWLDWSCGSTTTFPANSTVTKRWSVPGEIEITATISARNVAISPYNTGQWRGDILDSMYSGVNPIGLANTVNGQDPAYSVSFSATLDGRPLPLDIVVAEAEDTGLGGESATWTTTGRPWELIEGAGMLNMRFNSSGQSVTMTDTVDTGGGTVLGLAQNVSTVNVQMFAGGKEALAFGIFLASDFGDAPGYDTAGAYLPASASGGGRPTVLTPQQSIARATVRQGGGPYLGAFERDSEAGNQENATATGDDANGIDDEDGVLNFPPLIAGTTSYTMTASSFDVTGNGVLRGWIDVDKNGAFDEDEFTYTTISGGALDGDLVWTFDDIAPAGTVTYARFKILSGSAVSWRPDRPILNGEIEDYVIEIQSADIELEKAGTLNDGGDGIANVGDTVEYSFTVTNTGQTTLTDIEIDDDLVTVSGGPIAELASGASDSTTFTATYTLTQADLDAGEVENTATATAITFSGDPITDISDDPSDATNIDSEEDGEPDDPTIVELPEVEIEAIIDDFSGAPINSLNGGDTASVLTNDTLNGQVVDPADITLTPGSAPTPEAGSITMNPDGTITVAPGTTAGTYTYEYTICEIRLPTNCSTTNATIVVEPAPIEAVVDNFSDAAINGSNGGTTSSVLENDTLNGEVVDPAEITLTPGTAPSPETGSITMNPDGTITVEEGTSAGTYTYPYTICENFDPDNCSTTSATIVVDPAPIEAIDDDFSGTPITGASGGDTTSVLTNDTLNGEIVDPADITLTPGTAPDPDFGEITMNPDGTITVAPGTSAGTYTYDYTICENLNDTNCNPATATIVVGEAPIEAIVDDFSGSPVNGASGGDTASVLTNDTLNGEVVDPADIALTPGTQPNPENGEITMNPDGTITVAPGTTAGTYTYEYTICEVINPTNCSTTNATVVVGEAPIEAIDDDFSGTPITGASGGDTASVLTNDTLNGEIVDPADITLTPGTAPDPDFGEITMNPDGTITVAPGTSAGTYTYDYTICENLNDTNCNPATATIVVGEAPIEAIVDDFSGSPVNGASGGDTASVLTNDTLNGEVVDPADIALTPGTQPNPENGEITMNPDGTITVAPGTTAGTYTYEYTICEVINPTNCSTTNATVVVGEAPIEAIDDDFSGAPITGANGGDTASVLTNDTLNGQPVDPADITLTPGTAPNPDNGEITMNPDGTITVAPGTTAGTYTYNYTICEVLNETNCSPATATIVVGEAPIEAVVDDFSETPITGASGGNTPSVLTNDTLNGEPVDPSEITLTPGEAPNPGITMNPDGTITVAEGTPAGTYTYPYTICENLNPSNCSTTNATVVVGQAPIEAVIDEPTAVSGLNGATLPSVLANDLLNGEILDPADVTLTPGTQPDPDFGEIIMNPDGTITVAEGTTAGTYVYEYTICEAINPSNCSTTTATVIVDQAALDAVDDAPAPINGRNGGTTESVLGNDSLNGEAVDPADVTLEAGTQPSPENGEIIMNPDGTITVAPGTTAGTYTYPYTICETTTPTNCDTAVATIVVEPAPIEAIVDDFSGTPINGANGGETASVLTNDTLNGEVVDPAEITLEPGTAPNPASGSITMNPDGTITVAEGTTAGTYTYEYTICEVLNEDNCSTNTATIVVDPAPIEAIVDDFSDAPINGANGGTTGTVLANDTLNGEVVDPAEITLERGEEPNPENGSITMNDDGTITVAPGTTAGTYTYPYTICEVLNETNCATTFATVVVEAAPIEAIVDDFSETPINGASGGDTGSVLENDTLNGEIVDLADITIEPGTAPNPENGEITMNPDGTITVAPGTTAGTYTYSYTICEVLNETNCSTNQATIVVSEAPIEAIVDDFSGSPVNGASGGDTASVLDNDTLNGEVVDPADITLTPGTAPEPASGSITMNPDGTITVAEGTTAGTYTYEYTICENLNPENCSTNTATVVVSEAPIEAIVDDFSGSPVNGASGGDTASVLDNDTLNGEIVDPADITLTPGTAPEPASGSITMNPDGTITVAEGTTAGTYTYEYTICEILNPENCSTNTATVVVDAAPIDAVDDDLSGSPYSGELGGETPSVLENDTLNGEPVDPDAITLTPGTQPTPETGSIIMNPDGTITIAPGTSAGSYTYEYTICEILNPENCDTAVATIVVTSSGIDVQKTVALDDGGDGEPNVGDTLTYIYEVTNTGTATVFDVTVTETTFSGAGETPVPAYVSGGTDEDGEGDGADLLTGVTAIFSASYELTQEDLDAGEVTNQALGEGVDPYGEPVTDLSDDPTDGTNADPDGDGNPDDPTAIALVSEGAIALEKTGTLDAGEDEILNAGDTITYAFTVTNTGNLTLSEITIADPLVEVTGGPIATLAPGESDSATFTAVYTITQDDVNAGEVENSATVTGTNPSGEEITDVSDDPANETNVDPDEDGNPDDPTVIALEGTGGLTLEKTGTLNAGEDGVANAGDTISYAFTVTNNGTLTLSNITIDDPLVAVTGGPIASLEPGESDSTTFTAVYTITQDDLNAGEVENSATANGTDPSGNPVSDVSDDPANAEDVDADGDGNPDDPTVIALPLEAALSLLKTDQLDLGGDDVADVGDTIRYSFTVRNTGNITLSDVDIDDPMVEVTGGPLATLEPGDSDSATFTAEYVLTQADLDAGRVVNTATASATDPQGNMFTVISDDPDVISNRDLNNDGIPDDPTVTILPVNTPELDATKSVSNPSPQIGEVVTYTLTFENTGDVSGSDLKVIDELPSRIQYVEGSGVVDGSDQEPKINGRQLVWAPLDLAKGDKLTITFDARITVLDAGESAVNRTWATDRNGEVISNVAEAEISREPEHVFDCTDVIGKVFDDRDSDGVQDEGEPGMANVRVVTLGGELITTDEHGRFNVPCAAMPPSIGENISLKLDTRSLPTGYRLTTENPRVVRATAGKMVRINFGVSLGKVTDIDLMDAAFAPGTAQPTQALANGIAQMVASIRSTPTVLRLSYYQRGEDPALVRARLDTVEKLIRKHWSSQGRYKLVIERTSKRVQ
ncbi:CshA/CshB family fibrillar adhesin-related protein [Paracoccaceae bacterium GXU_MW_L88]